MPANKILTSRPDYKVLVSVSRPGGQGLGLGLETRSPRSRSWSRVLFKGLDNKSDSTSVTVTGPTGVTGSRVIKFGYKEFTVKGQRWYARCSNCNKRIQDKVNVTSAFTKCH